MNNCNLDGTEARFLIQLLTGHHVAIAGPAIPFANQLFEKLTDLHLNQPIKTDDDEEISRETTLLGSIQGTGR